MSLDAKQVIQSKTDTERPLIHHLTADNSWLLQLPQNGPRPFYNILIDAWLTEAQIQWWAWFHEQSHTQPCAAKSIVDVERFAGEIETLSRQFRSLPAPEKEPESYVDAVAISLVLTDHCNKETLTQLPTSVPVFAYGEDTVKLVQSWNHFETVISIPQFTGDWQSTSIDPLPSWIGIGGITQTADYSRLHFAVVVSFRLSLGGNQGNQSATRISSENDEGVECIVYMPHGCKSEDLTSITTSSPRLDVLASFHGRLRSLVGGRFGGFYANMGAQSGLSAARTLDSKYWIATHDEPKEEKGVTSWFSTQEWMGVDDAAAAYAEKTGADKMDILRKANWHDVESGGTLVLV